MECPNINSLIFSEASRDTIRQIKQTPGLANQLATSLSLGKIVNIFASAVPAPVTINSVQMSDWEGYIQAMGSIPALARRRIERLAEERWIDMQLENNVVEAKFWKAVYNGCKIR